MNDQQRAAMQMALEALENLKWAATERDAKNRIRQFDQFVDESSEAITALREALAQPQGDWVDLTNDDLRLLPLFDYQAKAVIAKFKEKNNPKVVPQGEPVAWGYFDEDGSFMDAVGWQHGAYQTPLYTTPPSVEAAIEREQQLFETFARIADYLCIDTEAARRAEGKPSDVFISAIEAAIKATLEKAAKVCEEPMYFCQSRAKTSGECAAAIRSMK